MQIVIEISKEDYDSIKYNTNKSGSDYLILNGKILPTPHGRLIDADAYMEKVFKKFPCNSSDDRNIRRLTELALKDEDTIIKADKTEIE